MTLRKILIGGQWQETGETFAVQNPYSGELLSDVANAGEDAIEASLVSAIESAKRMRSLARFQIAAGLRSISQGIAARKDEFVRTIALESAKPVIYARGEVERAIATFSWAAGEAERFQQCGHAHAAAHGSLLAVDRDPDLLYGCTHDPSILVNSRAACTGWAACQTARMTATP